MTIYIPVSVEKELPEEDERVIVFIGENEQSDRYSYLGNGKWIGAHYPDIIDNVSHWLKPIEVESLIEHVESFIAPQREDMREYAKEGIISFFNKFLTKNQ